jgi:uncharacterized protein (TIGR02246 family)
VKRWERRDGAAQAAREIRKAWSEYAEAHDEGDPDGVARWFTEDALILAPGLPEVRGRDGFRDLISRSFATASFEGLEIESRELDVHADRAWEIGSFTETMIVHGEDPRRLRGRFVVQWVRDEHGWRIRRYLTNAAPKG